jgi:hypothetical protein
VNTSKSMPLFLAAAAALTAAAGDSQAQQVRPEPTLRDVAAARHREAVRRAELARLRGDVAAERGWLHWAAVFQTQTTDPAARVGARPALLQDNRILAEQAAVHAAAGQTVHAAVLRAGIASNNDLLLQLDAFIHGRSPQVFARLADDMASVGRLLPTAPVRVPNVPAPNVAALNVPAPNVQLPSPGPGSIGSLSHPLAQVNALMRGTGAVADGTATPEQVREVQRRGIHAQAMLAARLADESARQKAGLWDQARSWNEQNRRGLTDAQMVEMVERQHAEWVKWRTEQLLWEAWRDRRP